MDCAVNFLGSIRSIIKLHQNMLKEICNRFDITLIEANIISFLCDNPEMDTAGDIVELRVLSKGNVSQGVESLIKKSLLMRKQDEDDRRKIHLSLLPSAEPITQAIRKTREKFFEEAFYGMSDEEISMLEDLNRRIMENTKRAMTLLKKSS